MVAFESLAVHRNPNQAKTWSQRYAGVSGEEIYRFEDGDKTVMRTILGDLIREFCSVINFRSIPLIFYFLLI